MHGIQQYQNYQIETVSSEDRVVLLYDGARRFTDKALAALQTQNYMEVSLYTGKAQRILAELAATLNFDVGEISHDLSRLYEYWAWRLTRGLVDKDPEAFREVSGVLSDLQEAWADAARQVRTQRGARAHG